MKKNILFLSFLIFFTSCGITKKDNIKKYDDSFKVINFNKSIVKWKIDLSKSNENNFGEKRLSAPVILDNKIIFSEDKKVYVVDYNSGKIISKRKLSYSILSKISKIKNNLIFFASDGHVHLVDKEFKDIWRYKLNFERVIGDFKIEDNIYFKTSKDRVLALDKEGKLLWSTSSHLSEFMPLLTDNKLLIVKNYLYAGFTDGRFIIIDKKDGKTVFEKTLSTEENFNDIVAPPVEKDGIIYIPSYAKGIIAFDTKIKEELWNTEISAISSLFFVKDKNYYLNNNSLLELDLKSGNILKKYNLDISRVVSSSLHNNRYIVITSSQDGVVILDLDTKNSIIINISSGLSNEPIFVDKNNMIIYSNNGILYRVRVFLK